ncbi:MAG: transposase [Sedimentitalea sp.]
MTDSACKLESVSIKTRGGDHKIKVLTLVERTTKKAKSVVINDLNRATLVPIVQKTIAQEAYATTDEALLYQSVGVVFGAHG